MTTPRAPRTATALSLDDSVRDSLNNFSHDPSGLGSRPRHPAPSPTPIVRQFDGRPTPTTTNAPIATQPVPNASSTAATTTAAPPHIDFCSHTIAPSPPPQFELPRPIYDSHAFRIATAGSDNSTASSAGSVPLRISTDFTIPPSTPNNRRGSGSHGGNLSSRGPVGLNRQTSSSSLRPISRTPSLKAALTNSIGSGSGTSSVIPSPIISAMGEVTPLPSPLLSADSPGPWKRLSAGAPSPHHQRYLTVSKDSVLVSKSGESIDAAITHAPKRKMYSNLDVENKPMAAQSTSHDQSQHHARNRSLSEYKPENVAIPRRQTTVSGSHAKIDVHAVEAQQEPHIRRELNLAQSRGLTPVTQPPTPPPSESSRDSTDGSSSRSRSSRYEYFEAYGRNDRKRRRWRSIRMLGQGTFSRVMLATSQMVPEDSHVDPQSGLLSPKSDLQLDRKTLVAVKVCEHGPRGGASEERVEMSLKRELEIMQTIHHPSLVDLKAWCIEPTRAILVLTYCPGGDLFDVATAHRAALRPSLMQRIFGELVGAVSYLHERRIVHRDIKLENVLVNLTPAELADPSVDWATYPYSVVTLTDLGLSRRIADDEKLETRCGSDDYAAPEVIMGQPYDGRATDAWSLGVLLYALLEARLPFDPHPGMSDAHRMRSRTSHRIARVEWRWVEYAGDDTDNDGDEAKFEEKGLLGAMEITEGLLKRARSRWSVEKVAQKPWVRDAIKLEGGLRFREEKDGEEV